MTPVRGYSEMKDSGTTWLGCIPKEWDISKIGSLYTLRNEKVSDKDYLPLSVTMKGIVPQLATAAKTDDGDNRKLVKVGDFAINSRSDRRGSCGISSYDGSVSLINTILTPRGQMHPGYYNWLFHTSMFADEFYKWGHGIVDDLWTTRWQEMKRILVPVPPYEIQTAIAAYLDEKCSKIDEIIASAKASIEDYKQWKASIIYEAVTKGLDSNVELKDSNNDFIGMIPKHWNTTKLGLIFGFLGGYAYSSDLYMPQSNNQVIRIGNVKNGYMIFDNNPVYISDDTANSSIKFKIYPGNILFTMTGTKGKRDYFFTHLVTKEDCHKRNLFLNQRVGCLIPKDNIDVGYYNYLLKNENILDSIFIYETGTANQGNLGIENIKQVKIQLPPKTEQVSIRKYLDKKCKNINSIVNKKQRLIDDLESYKKSLIYEVVTGKRKVC